MTPGNKNDMGEHEEHLWCGTPDCCMSCDTAEPVQLELWPVSIYEKDTNEKPLSFDGGSIENI